MNSTHKVWAVVIIILNLANTTNYFFMLKMFPPLHKETLIGLMSVAVKVPLSDWRMERIQRKGAQVMNNWNRTVGEMRAETGVCHTLFTTFPSNINATDEQHNTHIHTHTHTKILPFHGFNTNKKIWNYIFLSTFEHVNYGTWIW